MKKIFFTTILLIVFQLAKAQIAPYCYYIQFTDKNNSPYSIEHPEEFLTQRALERRQAQNIAIAENDIPVNPQYVQGVAATGAQIINTTRWLNGVTVYTADTSVLAAIRALPYVKNTVFLPRPENKIKKRFFENETIKSATPISGNRHLKNGNTFDYGYALNQIQQINGIGLHELDLRGQGMVIAILDAGFVGADTMMMFDSLRANNQILGTKDFVSPGGSVYTVMTHGMMVLSCMGANIPGLMIGTAPKASFWLLKTENGYYENVIEEYNWLSGAEFADSVGADIINSSLGYIDFDNPDFTHPYSDMDGNTCISTIAADIAASKGILVANSVGNSGTNQTFHWVGAPADADSILTVGAVDANGNRASFSSVGPTYDGRIKPTVMAKGLGTTVAVETGGVMAASGTSFSSPVIAGMTACLWQNHPELTNMEIIEAIKESASQYGNPDNYMGYGIPDYMKANGILHDIKTNRQNSRFAKIYPNPFGSEFKIEIQKKGEFSLELITLTGKVIFEKKINSNGFYGLTVNNRKISNLPAGIYFLKIEGNTSIQTLKVIKR